MYCSLLSNLQVVPEADKECAALKLECDLVIQKCSINYIVPHTNNRNSCSHRVRIQPQSLNDSGQRSNGRPIKINLAGPPTLRETQLQTLAMSVE